jgi:hypothetical protein
LKMSPYGDTVCMPPGGDNGCPTRVVERGRSADPVPTSYHNTSTPSASADAVGSWASTLLTWPLGVTFSGPVPTFPCSQKLCQACLAGCAYEVCVTPGFACRPFGLCRCHHLDVWLLLVDVEDLVD